MNIDAIFVITLDTAEKRREEMKKWYPDKANLQWFIVKRLKNPKRGCYSSHQKVLRMAKEKGFKKILILEDDAFPLYSWNEIVTKTNKALKDVENLDPNWKHLMLGYLPYSSKKTKFNNLLEMRCAADGHAYIVNVPKVKSIPWNGIQIDGFLFCGVKKKEDSFILTKSSKSVGVYGIKPMLITQKAEKSQIENFHLLQKQMIDFFGGEDNMAEVSCHVNILIFLFIIFFLILFLPIILALFLADQKIPCGVVSAILFLIVFICIILIIIDKNA